LLNLQITQYLKTHIGTDVYIVAHSLGGVLSFGYMAQLIEATGSNAITDQGVRLGTLKGISILDAPLGGVTNHRDYVGAVITRAASCDWKMIDYTAIRESQMLFNTATLTTSRGETASILNALMGGRNISNEQVATDAANAGIVLLIVGNTNDIMWQPDVCNNAFGTDMPNFLSTQYLQERGMQANGGALYSHGFTSGYRTCAAVVGNKANHMDVLNRRDTQTAMYIQTAIWEVFTGNPHATSNCERLIAPWVVLYDEPNFAGRLICFEGAGAANLTDYGFDKLTSSVNVAANGAFFDNVDGDGSQRSFRYGDREAQLDTGWDNKISAFRVES